MTPPNDLLLEMQRRGLHSERTEPEWLLPAVGAGESVRAPRTLQ